MVFMPTISFHLIRHILLVETKIMFKLYSRFLYTLHFIIIIIMVRLVVIPSMYVLI